MTRPTAALRRLVRERAGFRCEYCLVREEDGAAAHQVDHVIAEKHGGPTAADNLALSCLFCNRRKGSDIAAIDPADGSIVPLFDPRSQSWADHFRLNGPRVTGLTPTGRATVQLLQMNHPDRIAERVELLRTGRSSGSG